MITPAGSPEARQDDQAAARQLPMPVRSRATIIQSLRDKDSIAYVVPIRQLQARYLSFVIRHQNLEVLNHGIQIKAFEFFRVIEFVAHRVR